MLTGCGDLESAKRAVNEGCIFRFLTKPVTSEQIVAALRAAVDEYREGRSQKEQLEGAVEALEQLDVGTLAALARAIDAKSAWTAGHSGRVTALALKIAHAMALPAEICRSCTAGVVAHRQNWYTHGHSR